MCSLNSVIVAIILISVAMAKQLQTQDAIGFPEVEEDQNSVNKDVSIYLLLLIKSISF